MMIMINIIGLSLIALIIWWFWLTSAPTTKVNEQHVRILVDEGSYSPSRIRVKQNQLLTLGFLRKDPSPCAEKVIFETLNLSVDLPVDREIDISIPTDQCGEFEFTCQMKMYRGKLIIE